MIITLQMREPSLTPAGAKRLDIAAGHDEVHTLNYDARGGVYAQGTPGRASRFYPWSSIVSVEDDGIDRTVDPEPLATYGQPLPPLEEPPKRPRKK